LTGAFDLESLVEISTVFQEHPDDDIWEEYAFGRVRDSAQAALEEHLLACGRCQKTLARTDRYIRLMKAGTASFPANQPSHWKILPFTAGNRRAKAAAAFAVACMAALVAIGPVRSLVTRPSGAAAEPVEVKLRSVRDASEAETNRGPALRPLDLSIDTLDVQSRPPSSYRLEVVTLSGEVAWAGRAEAVNGALSAHVVKKLAKGAYWVRLYASSELLAEYGLKLE
jgi:hypothetical protein